VITFHPDRALAKPPDRPQDFAGRVALQKLVGGDRSLELDVVAVFFDDGARTAPHTHSTDQLLFVLFGTCVVADDAGRREVRAGEFAFLPAHGWHWHGAAPGQSACHISYRKPGPSDWTVDRRDW
jgi:quercetin dioxygenase-like cupin family protein